MIDNSELDNFYTGTVMPVFTNLGGMFLELGDEEKRLLYKINDQFYMDVNRPNVTVQVLENGVNINAPYVVVEDSLKKVQTNKNVKKYSNLVRKLTFNKSNLDTNN